MLYPLALAMALTGAGHKLPPQFVGRWVQAITDCQDFGEHVSDLEVHPGYLQFFEWRHVALRVSMLGPSRIELRYRHEEEEHRDRMGREILDLVHGRLKVTGWPSAFQRCPK